MRLLVAGGSGMLGRHVVRIAEEHGYEVTYPDHGQNGHASAWDIESLSDARHWVATVVPDVVINCAGLLPPQAALDPNEALTVNALGPGYLANVCRVEDVRYGHISTDCVFNGERPLERPYAASDAPDARDPYGATKAMGEKLVTWALLAGGDTTIIRTSFIGPQHGLWRWYVDNDSSVVPAFTNVLWSGSTVDIIAEAIVDIAISPGYEGVMHVGTADLSRKSEVLSALREVLPFSPQLELDPTPVINRWLRADYVVPPLDGQRLADLEAEYQRARA